MIKKYITRIRNNEFLRSTFTLFIATMLMNFFGYLFHFYVGRKLGPVDYGVYGALSSILYLLTVPYTAIQITITKFVSNFKMSNEYAKIKYLIIGSIIKLSIYGIIFVAVFLSLSRIIANFLHIETLTPLFLLGLLFIISILIPINRGVLQGLQDFKNLGYSYIMEGFVKLLSGIILVGLGLGVNGAIGAIILSYLIPFIFTFYFLRFIFREKKIAFPTKNIYVYSFPVFITTFLLTAFYSIDVILIKHFFSAQEAGYYWATSLLGKIVYFASGAVTLVLFPQVNELNLKNIAHKKIFHRALILVSLIGGSITAFYFLFSKFTVNLLFGNQYLAIREFIGFFSLAMALFSLVYVICFYNLSLNRTGFIYILLSSILLETILIYLFHETIMQVIFILLALLSFLLLSLFIFTIVKNEPINSNTGT